MFIDVLFLLSLLLVLHRHRTNKQKNGRLSSALQIMAMQLTELTEASADIKKLRQAKDRSEAKIVDLGKIKAGFEKENQDLASTLCFKSVCLWFPMCQRADEQE